MSERIIMIFPAANQNEADIEKGVRDAAGFTTSLERSQDLALIDRTQTGKSVARMWKDVIVLDAHR